MTDPDIFEGTITMKIQYFGEKSVESGMKLVSRRGAVTSVLDWPHELHTLRLCKPHKNKKDVTYKGRSGCSDCTTVDPPLTLRLFVIYEEHISIQRTTVYLKITIE